jgi:hypothetical protein
MSVVSIHGKEYMTVAGRIDLFWKYAEEKKLAGSIETDYEIQDNQIYAKSIIQLVDLNGVVVRSATGHAHEIIGSSQINRTSAIENAETSAVGRALGMLNFNLPGLGVATADEIEIAKGKEEKLAKKKRSAAFTKAVKAINEAETVKFIADNRDAILATFPKDMKDKVKKAGYNDFSEVGLAYFAAEQDWTKALDLLGVK